MAITGIALSLALGVSYLGNRPSPRADAPVSLLKRMPTPFMWPGIANPHICPAAHAALRDTDEVIGITAAGKSRAYLVAAFGSPQLHVVNDILYGKPVSVTHCDRSNCTRVYTASETNKPLAIGCAGTTAEGGLLLSAPGGVFDQETGHSLGTDAASIPYLQVPFTVTTWLEWKEAHPDTDVYTGE